MITTKRSLYDSNQTYVSSESKGEVGLLEREETNERVIFGRKETEEISIEDARARMQRNLDKLLNYDKYAEDATPEPALEAVAETAYTAVETNFQDEDIKPTSTTMQFGDDEVDQIYNDMHSRHNVAAKESYRLNSKGKLVVVLYSLAVAIILALIIINTGVLAALNKNNTLKQEELTGLTQELTELKSEISEITQDSYIIDVAEDFGMIKK